MNTLALMSAGDWARFALVFSASFAVLLCLAFFVRAVLRVVSQKAEERAAEGFTEALSEATDAHIARLADNLSEAREREEQAHAENVRAQYIINTATALSVERGLGPEAAFNAALCAWDEAARRGLVKGPKT